MGENFNKDELEAPEWMNNSFFEGVLKKCENDQTILVKDVQMSPATTKGDHYASVMFRAKVTYDSKARRELTKSMIIKTMPQIEGHKLEMLKESFIFETEIAMYSETIPKFERELRKIGDETVLGAKVLYHSLKPQKCIIFEDIVPLGYQTLTNRAANLEDSKCAILKLANWHAVSYKLAAEGDSSITDYKHGIFSIREFESNTFVQNGIKEFIAKCEEIDELKQYVPKLRVIQTNILDLCRKSFDTYRGPKSEGIFVLCHGDFHSKNMMFKKNSQGKTEDVILVDFQLCYFGPAILDVIYGCYMLVDEDARKNHLDELVYFYCSSFLETLENLKFNGDIPKIADFYIEILRHRHWEFFLMSTFLPLWYAFDCDGMDPEELLTSEEACRNCYRNEDYIKEVKRLLPIMFHRGYLEL